MVIHEKNKTWYRGNIIPWWGAAHRSLPWIEEPFNDQQAVDHWRSLGFSQPKFNGEMYDMRFAEPDWINGFRQHFDWQEFSWSVYKMIPGRILPEHSDTYARFCGIHGITDINQIWRAVVFLEDWQQGHYLDIDKTPVTGWQAGDVVVWQGATLHTAANVGMTDRYTLQITGIITK